jgi:hypothetical protein
MSAKVALDDGELFVSALTRDFDGDPQDEQIVAYRNLLEMESPIYITYIDFDNNTGGFRRVWSTPTSATRPGTITLYTLDMVGDRSICVLVTGMNGQGEHTLTILKKNSPQDTGDGEQPFSRIADLRIDGTISVLETERTQAYQRGLSNGQSFAITAYGRDYDSDNILDQVEITYTYNPVNGLYEQTNIVRVPGSQIEQRRVRELLSGSARDFEEFVTGLWYYVSSDGMLDNRQYIYFDPQSRELIFFGDETQQVFTWQSSSATRYGIYVSSQNISVTTLRRTIDIELESLESIRVKVHEDVRLPIGVNDSWDGSYRKAGAVENRTTNNSDIAVAPYIEGVYDGSIGKITFFMNGNYELSAGGVNRTGKYAFFPLDDQKMLEFRPGTITGHSRETYLVEPEDGEAEVQRESLSLVRVRLGTRGIEILPEGVLSLPPVDG